MRPWRQITRMTVIALATLALAAPALAQNGDVVEAVEQPPLLEIVMFLGIAAIAVVGGMALIRMLGDE
ncbi:MAG: hypothetical protein H6671_13290 [Anaerolineaceae bacterium]|nr:hypothetical protein [Anaerolineaceae bacterium]